MRSGELARVTGVSTDTLRHYERLGLLKRPARTAGNYRAYDSTARDRVELIQRSLKIGFTLRELRAILAERDSGGVPCRRVRDLLGAKIQLVEEQLRNLAFLEADLKRLRARWDAKLRGTKPGHPAHLLDNMATTRTKNISRSRPQNLKSRKGK